MTLTELFRIYPTDKETAHSYGPVYDQLLSPLRESATQIMEIGVDKGGSLLAWRDYFPNARILGLDIEPKYCFDDGRISTFKVDVSSHILLRNALWEDLEPESCDLIIDDGPHNLVQQFGCLFILWRFLKPGGLYIIEDALQMYEYHTEPYHIPLDRLAEMRFIDRTQVKGRTDDYLAIFTKEKGA